MLIQSLQKFRPVVISDSMTYSAPQADSITYEAPQVPVPSDSVAATEAVIQHPPVAITGEEFLKIKASCRLSAPQAPVPSESVTATGKVIQHPPVAVTAEEFVNIKASVVDSLAMASQSVTYEAPQTESAPQTDSITYEAPQVPV